MSNTPGKPSGYGLNAPMVRIELDGLRQSVVHALTMAHERIQGEVDAELQRQIESFDLTACVRDILAQELKSSVQYAMQAAVREAMQTPEFKERLAEYLRRDLTWDWDGKNDPRRLRSEDSGGDA